MSLVSSALKSKSLISILKSTRTYYTVGRKVEKDENYLARHLFQKIKAKGPMTIADYMKEVLVNPLGGYYMHKDVFGEHGDFITSPEITQMFGEMIAVWFLNEWHKLGSPKPLQLIELGPGRGTLSCDILRVFEQFKALHKASLHLVEVSPHLSEIQAKKLCTQSANVCDMKSVFYKQGMTHQGVPVKWYKQLIDVPRGFTFLIAHEFFDALPIHKFHRTFNGYKEVLIDTEHSEDTNEMKFRYVLAKQATPMLKVLLDPHEAREHIEIAPDSILISKEICNRLKNDGGIALICDYGHDGAGTDTFRAFKQHKQVDPLVQPGTADLTADVDFNALRKVATEDGEIICLGPVQQKDFLLKIGLNYRFKCLANNITNEKHLDNLKACYDMLTDEDQMGSRFKFFAMLPDTFKKVLDKYPVVGFK